MNSADRTLWAESHAGTPPRMMVVPGQLSAKAARSAEYPTQKTKRTEDIRGDVAAGAVEEDPRRAQLNVVFFRYRFPRCYSESYKSRGAPPFREELRNLDRIETIGEQEPGCFFLSVFVLSM